MVYLYAVIVFIHILDLRLVWYFQFSFLNLVQFLYNNSFISVFLYVTIFILSVYFVYVTI